MNAETRKLNELIFEYLRWNGYQYTAEMLLTGIQNLITEFIFSKIRFFFVLNFRNWPFYS